MFILLNVGLPGGNRCLVVYLFFIAQNPEPHGSRGTGAKKELVSSRSIRILITAA